MKQRVNFDSTIKDLIQRDRPSLLTQLSGGIAIRAFLNVELPKVQDRKLDLVLLLEDGSILHIEIQSTHDSEIAYRMLDYYSLLKRRYKRPTRQVLLYVGEVSCICRIGSLKMAILSDGRCWIFVKSTQAFCSKLPIVVILRSRYSPAAANRAFRRF
jgi:hypothetical protein